MGRHIAFVTTGDIEHIATTKRAFGMSRPLVERGYTVSILLEDTPANRARVELEAPMAETHYFTRMSAFAELREKRRILRQIMPDIVYVGSYGIRNMVSPVRPLCATYLVEHSELPSAILNRPVSRRILDYVLERMTLRCFDGQVCASRYLMEFVQSKLPLCAKDAALYSPYAFSRNVLLPDGSINRPDLDARSQRLLYMGTLAPNYGIFLILEAMALLRDDLDVQLIVLGKGRAFDKAVARSQELGLSDVVDFKGYVPESALPFHLGQADAFVAPLFDTVQDIARCPSKMFMYTAYSRPIVTSQIGEARELFGPDYRFYFEPKSAKDMAERLYEALQVPADWMPDWDPADHEWETRVDNFDKWLCALRGDQPASPTTRDEGFL